MVKPDARARRRRTRPPGLAVRAVFWVCQKMAGRPLTSVNTNWERARRGRSSTRSIAGPLPSAEQDRDLLHDLRVFGPVLLERVAVHPGRPRPDLPSLQDQ